MVRRDLTVVTLLVVSDWLTKSGANVATPEAYC